jgi:hypothetical protein
VTETPQRPVAPIADTDANEADIQEQTTTVDEVETVLEPSATDEVDEYDAAEQGREIELDPDEYR